MTGCAGNCRRLPISLSDNDQHRAVTSNSSKHHDLQSLDTLTGGAFTAPTSGERAQRIRDWLASSPSPEQMQEVFKELSGRDKGAARLLREKLDEIKRAKGQEAIGVEWAQKAEALLAQAKLNIADALAWQRDAAKAGAPLSREPLATLKARLAERVKGIEDLQHRAQVQREAAVLLAQRFEVLSTKGWRDAQGAEEALRGDVAHWQQQATELAGDANWSSLDAKFGPQLEASKAQLLSVSDAFHVALGQAVTAAADTAAPLPPVPVWADELRAARGLPTEAGAAASATAAAPGKPSGARGESRVDPEKRAVAQQAVQAALETLEKETAEGHGKASAGAAAALRAVLKEHGKLVEAPLEARVHAALVSAGELEGWQRWSADKVREDLVAKAEGLLKRPEGQALGGRKMQESLRALRDQWKQADQGGVPNHGLWKRFDEACNEAHKVVEAWLEKVRADAAEHRAHRVALIEEVRAWAAAHADAADLKAHNRALHQFADRWRDAGHVGEKMFAELQPQWNEAFGAARAPFEAAQRESVERRQAMIAEAVELGAAPVLRIDAVKALQQRWQAEAQGVPLDRRHEQKMWDAFRAPIDEAFNRKTAEREKASSAMSEFDRHVLDASKALDAANATGDVQKIRAAVARLEGALRGEAPPPMPAPAAPAAAASADGPPVGATEVVAPGQAAAEFGEAAQVQPAAHESDVPSADASADADEAVPAATAPVAPADLIAPADSADAGARADGGDNTIGAVPEEGAAEAPVAAPPKPAPKPVVVARRGDDRPGSRKAEPMPAGRDGRFGGDRRDGRTGPGGPGRPNDRGPRPDARGGNDRGGPGAGAGGGRFGDRGAPRFEERGPRLGDAAFRAQREALERAELSLRKLAAQAHGEALTQLMGAWEKRDASQLPSVQELGRAVTPVVRSAWSQALGAAPSAPAEAASEALLRLEMAAEVPTPADQLDARRALQLKLLTRRADPAPAQTWGQDAGKVLAAAHEPNAARRLQNALKALLRK
jgi:ATP-dependent RNA helicase SUPV3L1/SUV3